jgi:predicted phosphoribosyltransferase
VLLAVRVRRTRERIAGMADAPDHNSWPNGVAQSLGAPLDIFVVRKIGVADEPEFAIGAITKGRICMLDPDVVADLAIDQRTIDAVTECETEELERRERWTRSSAPRSSASCRGPQGWR